MINQGTPESLDIGDEKAEGTRRFLNLLVRSLAEKDDHTVHDIDTFCQMFLQQFHPMQNRHFTASLEMGEATNIRGGDEVGLAGLQRFQFVAKQPQRNIRL